MPVVVSLVQFRAERRAPGGRSVHGAARFRLTPCRHAGYTTLLPEPCTEGHIDPYQYYSEGDIVGRALGEFEQLILFALVELGRDGYGAAVGRSIETRTGRRISAGAIYTGLDRLESRGMVESRVGEPTPERGGRRRKHYRLTAEGADALRRSVEVMRVMSEGLLADLDALVRDGGS